MSEQHDDQWSKKLIKELATDALKERRRSRRWGIFFKTLTFAYLIGLLYVAMPDTFDFDDEAWQRKIMWLWSTLKARSVPKKVRMPKVW